MNDELLDVVIDAGLSREYNTALRNISTKLAREIIQTKYDDLTAGKFKELQSLAEEVFPKSIKGAKFQLDLDDVS